MVLKHLVRNSCSTNQKFGSTGFQQQGPSGRPSARKREVTLQASLASPHPYPKLHPTSIHARIEGRRVCTMPADKLAAEYFSERHDLIFPQSPQSALKICPSLGPVRPLSPTVCFGYPVEQSTSLPRADDANPNIQSKCVYSDMHQNY